MTGAQPHQAPVTSGPSMQGHSRSIVVPALMAGMMIAAFVTLGLWQLARKAEKATLIAALEARVTQPAQDLPPAQEWPALTRAKDEFRHVRFVARFTSPELAWVYATRSAVRPDVGGNGYWLFARGELETGEAIVVNRGFVPDGAQVRATQQVIAADATLTGYIRFDESRGAFVPADEPAKRLWFARDTQAMARALGWGAVAPFYIDLEGPTPASGLPKPGPLSVTLPDNHLSYALTWFALALAGIILFAIWLRGWRRDRAEGFLVREDKSL